MNKYQRQVAFDYAQLNYAKAEVEVDADVPRNDGFDEVEDGVWVQAWIKVPAEHIPNYTPPQPAPASTVKVQGPAAAWPFPTQPRHPHLNNDTEN